MEHHTLDTGVIPGTTHLVDLAGTLNIKHDSEGGHKDVVLLPQPSKDFDDPLNWSRWRKLLAANVLLLVVFMGDIMCTLLSAALLVIEKDTGISVSTLNQGIGVMYLFFGWSNLLWQPLGLTIGRRPVILVSLLGMIGCSVWTAYVKSSGEWYANRVLIGFFYGPIETLVEICLADLFFVHERGYWLGIYCWDLFAIPFLGSVPAGFVATNLGWDYIQYITSAICGGLFLIVFFFLEETMFYREPVQEEIALETSGTSDDDAKQRDQKEPPSAETAAIDEKNAPPMEKPAESDLGEVVTKKTYLEKLKFWGARRPGQPNNFFRSFWMPFTLVRFPVVLFSGILVGSVLMWFNAINATISLVLSAPPYNFSSDMVGVMFIAPFIGCTIGCIFAGISADKFAVWVARKHGGIFEPEYRLWMALLPLILHPVGCILFGVGAHHGIHWMGIAVGLACTVGTFPIGSALAINYIVDSYREIAGDAMVTMILIRNS